MSTPGSGKYRTMIFMIFSMLFTQHDFLRYTIYGDSKGFAAIWSSTANLPCSHILQFLFWAYGIIPFLFHEANEFTPILSVADKEGVKRG